MMFLFQTIVHPRTIACLSFQDSYLASLLVYKGNSGPRVAEWSKALSVTDHCHLTSVCVGSSLVFGECRYVRKLASSFSWVGGSFR